MRYNEFQFEELASVTRHAVELLDDLPAQADTSIMRTHSTIGVQGLADVFLKLSYAFDSPAAQQLSIDISAAVYHSATNANADLAIAKGCLPVFGDSLTSLGIVPCLLSDSTPECARFNWEQLAAKLQNTSVRRPCS